MVCQATAMLFDEERGATGLSAIESLAEPWGLTGPDILAAA